MKNTVRTFVVLSLGSALLYWLVCAASRRGALPFTMAHDGFFGFFPASIPAFLLWAVTEGFGPALAGVAAVAIHEGRPGLTQLGRSLVRFKGIGARTWLLAVLGPVAVNAVVLAATAAIVGVHADRSRLVPTKLVLLFLLMILFDGPLGEEVGWRGVLLPRLLGSMGPVRASLLVGLVWWLWHIPPYLGDRREVTVGYFAIFLVDVLAYSFVFTWFFLRSGGSAGFLVLLHALTNFSIFLRSRGFPRSGESPWPFVLYELLVVALAVLAGVSVGRMRRPASIESS